MKKSIVFVFIVNALLLTGCSTHQCHAQWEYKNITIIGNSPDQDPGLNQLGKRGWIVVGFVHEPGDSQHNEYYRYVLKHRIE